MSMCRVFSCVVGRGCLLWPVRSLGKTLLAFALLYSVLKGQICLLLQVFLDFLLLHSSPLWWKGHLFWVLVLESLVGLQRTIQLRLLQCYWSGIGMDHCDIEWFALEMNRDHSINMPANLENSAVATGLEKVSFHSSPKDCSNSILHKRTHFTY